MGMRKFLLSFLGVVLFGSAVLVASSEFSRWNHTLKHVLLNLLVKNEPMATIISGSSSNIHDSVIYVLGGAPESLKVRLEEAPLLYRQGVAKKILIDNDDLLMEYSSSVARNLSHNEWATGQLVRVGVKKEDIEAVVIEDGLWGTFSEAKTISHVVSSRGYRTLILVSSDYHTARVWYTFRKFMHRDNVNLFIYPVKDNPTNYMLLQELVKFACYRIFL
jgi:uncharacterized SAM-binding protein YcdF (DUF218 family)